MKRTKRVPGRNETLVSGIILLLLAGIAAGIYQAQFIYDRTDTVLQLKALAVKPAAPETALLSSLPAAIEQFTALEEYRPDNLYEKINGKADLYLSAGFQKLTAQRFRLKNKPDAWLEILAYEMDSGVNAFAVFSLQQRDSARPSDVARFAYQTPNALFFVHGRFYVEIVAAEAGEALSKAASASARQFVKNRPVTETEIPELNIFPRKHLVAGSIELTTTAAFGFERLDHVFTAEYQVADQMMTAFISKRKNEAAARQLADDLTQYFITYDGKPALTSIQHARAVELFGSTTLIFAQGIFLAGVYEAEDRAAAETLAKALIQNLSEAGHDNR